MTSLPSNSQRLPRREPVRKSVVHVPPYVRADGTRVDGYTYTREGGGSMSSLAQRMRGLAERDLAEKARPGASAGHATHAVVAELRRRLGDGGGSENPRLESRLRALERSLGPGEHPAGRGVRPEAAASRAMDASVVRDPAAEHARIDLARSGLTPSQLRAVEAYPNFHQATMVRNPNGDVTLDFAGQMYRHTRRGGLSREAPSGEGRQVYPPLPASARSGAGHSSTHPGAARPARGGAPSEPATVKQVTGGEDAGKYGVYFDHGAAGTYGETGNELTSVHDTAAEAHAEAETVNRNHALDYGDQGRRTELPPSELRRVSEERLAALEAYHRDHPRGTQAMRDRIAHERKRRSGAAKPPARRTGAEVEAVEPNEMDDRGNLPGEPGYRPPSRRTTPEGRAAGDAERGRAKLERMRQEFSAWAAGYNWATMDPQARAWRERRKKEGAIKREETRQRKAAKPKRKAPDLERQGREKARQQSARKLAQQRTGDAERRQRRVRALARDVVARKDVEIPGELRAAVADEVARLAPDSETQRRNVENIRSSSTRTLSIQGAGRAGKPSPFGRKADARLAHGLGGTGPSDRGLSPEEELYRASPSQKLTALRDRGRSLTDEEARRFEADASKVASEATVPEALPVRRFDYVHEVRNTLARRGGKPRGPAPRKTARRMEANSQRRQNRKAAGEKSTADAVTAKLREHLNARGSSPDAGKGFGGSGQRMLNESPARGASGKVRNVGAMGDEKLLRLEGEMQGSPDAEGAKAVADEVQRRGLNSPAAEGKLPKPKGDAARNAARRASEDLRPGASPARSPAGRIRNLRQMSDTKLEALAAEMRGSDDVEALQAVLDEMRRRFGG